MSELLQEIERSLILYRAEEYSTERTGKEILAKVKEKGWKSPEEVAAEKIVSYQVGSVDQREWLEKDGWLKWNRELVAEALFYQDKPFTITRTYWQSSDMQDFFLRGADQLHKILTGG